jgi:methylmalonyl-CoA mutase N-terminal domain/subunit
MVYKTQSPLAIAKGLFLCYKNLRSLTICEVKIMKREQVLWAPEDLEAIDSLKDIGFPGEFPYTRGIHPNMYRGRLWTMRQFAGFGLPDDTNKRFRKLWDEGETGFSTAFDLATLLGYDSDDPHSLGEVGKGGVAVDSMEDMMRLFRGIPIGRRDVSVSMTINAPACVFLAMYVVLAGKKRAKLENLRGTIQNDMLKEFTSQNETIVPHNASMKIFVDTVEFCTKYMPQYNPISISGYHMREAGATAVQELAFTLADGIAYVEACIERGLDVDAFAPRFSFFFNAHNDFFEEIAKFRAARRMWAHIMRDRFGAKNEASWKLRFHAQTSGVSLVDRQPKNNIMRVTLQAFAAVLGGAQSVHTDAWDEQISLPSEEAALLALRTQQIIAHETGVADVVDPLGGSYFMESITREIEEKAWEYIERIDNMGGMVRAVENDFPRGEIERSSVEFEEAKNRGEAIIVGVNKFQSDEADKNNDVPFRANPRDGLVQARRLEKLRAKRDGAAVGRALCAVEKAAYNNKNVMPPIIEAVKAFVTEGEIVKALKNVHGDYKVIA